MQRPEVNSKWKPNDPRDPRVYVTVKGFQGDHALVENPNGRTTSIALKVFGATHQRGFTEVKA